MSTINFFAKPANSDALITDALLTQPLGSATGAPYVDLDAVEIGMPHRVFVLEVHTKTGTPDLSRAVCNGVRSFLRVGDKVVAVAEVSVSDPPVAQTADEFKYLSFGSAISRQAAMMEELWRTGVAGPATQSFELALLCIPAINIETIWLRPTGSGAKTESKVVPLKPHTAFPANLRHLQAMGEYEFVQAITPACKEFLRTWKPASTGELSAN